MTLKEKLHSHKELKFEKENCNAPFILRFISLIIDTAIILLASFGFQQLLMLSPIKDSMEYQTHTMGEISDHYKLVSEIGVMTYLTDENRDQYKNYIIYTDELGLEFVVTNVDNPTPDNVSKYKELIKNDPTYQTANSNYNRINYGVLCLVFFTSEIIFLLFVPLFNKRRATIGELCCSTLCFNVKRSVKANGLNLIGRFLFIFIIETALPCLILGELTLIFIPLIRIAVMAISKERRCLSDFVSHTMHIHKDNYYPVVDDLD